MSDHAAHGVTKVTERLKSEFIIAGDSHIFSMGASQGYSGPVSLVSIEGVAHGYFLMDRWRGGRDATYWDALTRHSKNRVVVLVVMGNQHFANFMLAQMPLFDFVDPTDPGHILHPQAVIVPRRMVKASPSLSTERVRGIVRQLQTNECRHIILCGTPPVREDFGEAQEEVRKSSFFRERAKQVGVEIATCAFTPAPIMKRIWGLLQESLLELARETGTAFLPVPDEAINAKGYLTVDFHGPLWNFTHPNEAYGRLMLDRIVRAVGEISPKSNSPRSSDLLSIPPGHTAQ